MFIKTTKAKDYEYIKLVESYRDEKNVTKHKVLFNFGRADLIKNQKSFINMVKRLCEIAEIGVARNDEIDCGEAVMLKYGHVAYAKLWESLGVGNCLRELQNLTNCEFSLNDTVFLMAVQHLLLPKSKLGTYGEQENYYGIKRSQLHHMYRALDKIGGFKESIEDKLFKENYTKAGHSVDVVFYDVTTFAFESVIADELRDFGFSKACKFNEVQVVMGLLIDADGLPIGYELFPGNTFDGKTMKKALDNIKKRFGIRKVVIVADRGLNSKINLKDIKEAGYGYIVASKIKGMKRTVREQIFDDTDYVIISEEFRYKTIAYTNTFKDEEGKVHNLAENLIVSYSAKRAKKDCADRQRLIDKAKKMLENPANIKSSNKRGGKKYLAAACEKTEYSLDEERINADSKFDGYYGIQTSEKEMSADEVIDAYHTLWRIEESFRTMKSTLEVRPIFHWKPKRIHGHFVVCFLSFMLERKLEILLREAGIDHSPDRIQEALNTMQLANVTLDGKDVYIKAKSKTLAGQIFKILKMKQPENISDKKQLDTVFKIKPKDPWGQLALF